MIKVQQNAHRALKIEGGKNTMRKFLATLLALVMTLALMVPASWGENKETYQLPDSLEGKTVILHTNDVHGASTALSTSTPRWLLCGTSATTRVLTR